MPLHVHLTYPSDADKLAYLYPLLRPDISVTTGSEVDPNTEIIVAGRPSATQLEASPALHSLIIPWAGLPAETADILPNYPHLAVHNLHHNAAIVAETTLSLLLAAAKLTIPYDRTFRQHDWHMRYAPPDSIVLRGKTAVVLGYGAIGKRVSNLCHAIGMNVFATRRRLEQPQQDGNVHLYPAAMWQQLLPQANILIICLPHTAATDNLIDDAALAQLPPQAILINIGRARIVDETALYNALAQKRLHSAAIDVWYNYPPDKEARTHTPPANHPFHELDNIVMSPHRAGHATNTEQLRMAALADLLNKAAAGQPMPNAVDRTAGY